MSTLQQYPVATFMLALMCATAVLVAAELADSPNRDSTPTGHSSPMAAPPAR